MPWKKGSGLTGMENVVKMAVLEYALDQDKPFSLCAELRNGLASEIDEDYSEFESLEEEDFDNARDSNEKIWADFWSKSGIYLEDKELESIWYRNLFLQLCCKTRCQLSRLIR